jgi:hypothetical protein
MEPTPIFADLAGRRPEPDSGASAHREGRSVTDLLHALRTDTTAPATATPTGPPAVGGRRVGHVPHLLSF